MKFKAAGRAVEFNGPLHPAARGMAMAFDSFCVRQGYGEAMVTSVSRRPTFYRQNGLTPKAFSWHYVDCAVDFRNKHLTPEQRADCEQWLKDNCPGPEWELVLKHKEETEDHFHVAYRDFRRRRTWEQDPMLGGEPTPADGTSVPPKE